MTRQQANLEILKKLSRYLHVYPDVRFSQALHNLRLVSEHTYDDSNGDPVYTWKDEFYVEPNMLLQRMN